MAAEELKIEATGAVVADLPPIPMSPELQKAMETDPNQELPETILEYVTPKEIAAFLKEGYEAHGLLLREREIWQQTDEWYAMIAEAIAPDINKLCARMPQVGHAIKAVNAAGGWGKLAWDYAKRWALTVMKKNEQKQAQEAKPHEQPRTIQGPRVDYEPGGPANAGGTPSARPGPAEPVAQPVGAVQPQWPTIEQNRSAVAPGPSGDIFRVDYTPGSP